MRSYELNFGKINLWSDRKTKVFSEICTLADGSSNFAGDLLFRAIRAIFRDLTIFVI